jgi:hypothetical protein
LQTLAAGIGASAAFGYAARRAAGDSPMLAANTIPPIVQALVVLGVGTLTTLMAYGVIPPSLDAKKAVAWRKRYGRNLQIGGPLVIAAGLALLARAMWF